MSRNHSSLFSFVTFVYMQTVRRVRVLAALVGWGLLAFAQSSSPPSGVDLTAMDKSADPCQNFYQYACGNWIRTNPVPPQYSRWGRFNELQNHNQEVLGPFSRIRPNIRTVPRSIKRSGPSTLLAWTKRRSIRPAAIR